MTTPEDWPKCGTCKGKGTVRCACMHRPISYSNAGDPNHDGSPDECPDCYQGRTDCTHCTNGRDPNVLLRHDGSYVRVERWGRAMTSLGPTFVLHPISKEDTRGA